MTINSCYHGNVEYNTSHVETRDPGTCGLRNPPPCRGNVRLMEFLTRKWSFVSLYYSIPHKTLRFTNPVIIFYDAGCSNFNTLKKTDPSLRASHLPPFARGRGVSGALRGDPQPRETPAQKSVTSCSTFTLWTYWCCAWCCVCSLPRAQWQSGRSASSGRRHLDARSGVPGGERKT